jgi:hypothetical protein
MRSVRTAVVFGLLCVFAPVSTALGATSSPGAPLTARARLDHRAEASARANFGLLQQSFPALATTPGDVSATAGSALGTTVRSYPADNVARIAGPEGRAVVIATRPLRVLDDHGRSLPVDLTLQQGSDGRLVPRTAPFSLSIAGDPSRGFALGPDADRVLHVTPLSQAPEPAAYLQNNELFAADTHLEADTLLRPTTTGLETYEQLRGPEAPSVFAWRLDLRGDQRAALVDGALVVTQDGQPIVGVPEPVAFDAEHRLVPSTVRLADGVLSVTLSPPADVSYPVVVDPDWQSNYDWSSAPGAFGTEGWFRDASSSAVYQTFILTAPETVTTSSGPAVVDAGLTILPDSGTGHFFVTGDGAKVAWGRHRARRGSCRWTSVTCMRSTTAPVRQVVWDCSKDRPEGRAWSMTSLSPTMCATSRMSS